MIKIPKYLIGDADPESDVCWVVRSRSPLLIGLVEPMGILSLRVHFWPPEVEKQTTPTKLHKIACDMAEMWCAEVDELPGLPSNWSYVFDQNMEAPEHLVCDTEHFTGILRLKEPAMWLIPHHQNARELYAVAAIGESTPFTEAVEESWSWWLAFCDVEDTIRHEETDDDIFQDEEDF